jgi:7-cyano-7-deazaguanine tRNA-ribosyltransferase
MEVVVGLSLKNLKPRVWDPASPFHVKEVQAVMVSYADFDQFRKQRKEAMDVGLRTFLGVPEGARVYLDNGSFAFHRKEKEVSREEYIAFVAAAKPDWYPSPQDYIPFPAMTSRKQAECFRKTMAENLAQRENGVVPVFHVGRFLRRYIQELLADDLLAKKPRFAIGGLVPNLLRASRALPYRAVLDSLCTTRRALKGKELHLFGVGGTATLHLAALLGIDSVDSSGWRNRAARGIVQLPGRGDRFVAKLGSWRGRQLSEEEWKVLRECQCPACKVHGTDGLIRSGIDGFCNRATHNVWTLLREGEEIEVRLAQGLDVYKRWYSDHVSNSVYEPLIAYLLGKRQLPERNATTS